MPEGGKLTVTVGKRKISQADVDRNEGLRSGQRARMGDWVVSVEIADEGTGIPKENLGNVFDPFFTTRSTGRALGLGLTVCRKIVDLHGGTITAASSEAGGTRMTILLPIAPNDPINTPD
jgi:Signal transduction histidine kinase